MAASRRARRPSPAAAPSSPAREARAPSGGTAPAGRDVWAIAVALVAITVAAYAPVWRFDFVSLDDPLYVTGNPHVTSGLTAASIAWAFTAGYAANWHPITWLSHMLDVSLFGVSAPASHVVNLALHIGNTLLLFALLRRMTRAVWPSAIVAALFAVHPLHVESVAWIAERKDVLSTCGWLVTMWLYVRYVEDPSARRYGLVLGSFAIALMAKPMVITLPFVLLLLDYWPLGRWAGAGALTNAQSPVARRTLWRLVIEKLPLMALAGLSSLITFRVQHAAGAMSDYGSVAFSLRAANAVTSYAHYLRDAFWPAGLAVFYPFPRAVPATAVAAAAAVLVVVSVTALWLARRAPYVIVGWLWYLGTLVPVIGLVQVGSQARADRYTYVPLIGIFVAVVWSLAALVARTGAARTRSVALAAAAAIVTACGLATHAQVQYWRDPMTLWQRAYDAVPDNYRADASLGVLDMANGDTARALSHFQAALEFEPNFLEAHHNVALMLAEHGQVAEATTHFREVVRITPNSAQAHADLGQALTQQGQLPEAIAELEYAVALDPSSAIAADDLGAALAQADRLPEALPHFQDAVRLSPNMAQAHFNLALALAKLRRFPEARREFGEVLRINPANAAARQAYDDLSKGR